MDCELTKLQAFNVMRKFLENYYEKTLSDDIGALLGDLQLLQDNRTADPAAWNDWLNCINQIVNEK
ncbi:MAG: hypothetical protein WC707_03220 [Candidatus Babeliaceae bacterium]|jgi:hypothetical protein